jgi:hypothetical protein
MRESTDPTTILPRNILPQTRHHLPEVIEKRRKKEESFHEFSSMYPGAPAKRAIIPQQSTHISIASENANAVDETKNRLIAIPMSTILLRLTQSP